MKHFWGVLRGREFGNSVTSLQIPACAVALSPGAGKAHSDVGYELCIFFLAAFQFSILFIISSPFFLGASVHIAAKSFMAVYSCFG